MPKYNFAFLDKFKKDYKSAKKKNLALDTEFEKFLDEFDHTSGLFVSGTNGAQKIRLQRENSGKSGGYRIYYYFSLQDKVYLLRFYAKSEKEELTIKEKAEILEIIKAIKSNIN